MGYPYPSLLLISCFFFFCGLVLLGALPDHFAYRKPGRQQHGATNKFIPRKIDRRAAWAMPREPNIP